jgi:hypothetical protein
MKITIHFHIVIRLEKLKRKNCLLAVFILGRLLVLLAAFLFAKG